MIKGKPVLYIDELDAFLLKRQGANVPDFETFINTASQNFIVVASFHEADKIPETIAPYFQRTVVLEGRFEVEYDKK